MRHAEINPAGRPPLAIVGVHTASEAYPNTMYRLIALRKDFEVSEVNVPLLAADGRSSRVASNGLASGWRLLCCHMLAFARGLALSRPVRVYVPYPSLFILLLWSLLPRRLRPQRVVADAFISIFDTVVNDRGLLPAASWRAQLLRVAERRAYDVADRIIVDTAQNAAFYAQLFSLSADRFLPIPLSTNETDYHHTPYVAGSSPCRVLFVGTLIPLHGIETILAAAVQLGHRSDICFSVIGDGQEAGKVEAALRTGLANLEWDRTWRSPAELAAAIADADICLGVFGVGGKAQRVCPYKLYAYSAMGRAVITGATGWLESALADFGERAFATVAPGDVEGLAMEIVRLAEDPSVRVQLAGAARRFYAERLGNEEAAQAVNACLMENVRQSTSPVGAA